MFNISVDYRSSFYLKTNPDTYKDSIIEVIQYLSNDIVDALKDESPVRTGRLRDGHYSIVEGFNAYIRNDVPYLPFVVYGTSRQAPNNYPQRVIMRIGLGSKGVSLFEESLIMRGVL